MLGNESRLGNRQVGTIRYSENIHDEDWRRSRACYFGQGNDFWCSVKCAVCNVRRVRALMRLNPKGGRRHQSFMHDLAPFSAMLYVGCV